MSPDVAQAICFISAGVFFVVILAHRYNHESKAALGRLAASVNQLPPHERVPAIRSWARATANFQSILLAAMLGIVSLTAVLSEGQSALQLAPVALVALPLFIVLVNASGRFFYSKVGSRALDAKGAGELLRGWE